MVNATLSSLRHEITPQLNGIKLVVPANCYSFLRKMVREKIKPEFFKALNEMTVTFFYENYEKEELISC
jgi:hypothetical protein